MKFFWAPAFYHFGDRCGWFNKPYTNCHATITLDDDTTKHWSVNCATPSAGQDPKNRGHENSVDDDRCGITSVFERPTDLSSNDRVATPGHCTANTGTIPIECAILRKPGQCRKAGYVTYTPAKALYCDNGTNGTKDGCTTIDVMCGDDSCVIPTENPDYRCP